MAQLTATIRANDQISNVLKKVQLQTEQTKHALESLGSNSIGGGASQSITGLGKAVSKSTGLLGKMAGVAKSALAIFGGFSLISGAVGEFKNSLDGALDRMDTMETFERKMRLITGSSDDAKFALEEMNEATTDTAYRLDTATKAVQNFVTRGMTTEDATESVKIWMDAVSAYGKGTSEEFESVSDAIAKMRTKGTVEMKQLNRLFAVGINPVQMYAQVMGTTAAEVQEALTNKDLRTEEFLQVVETAMREGTNGVVQVAGMAKEVGTTWAATLSNSHVAIMRGTISLVEAVNDSFKVFDPQGGLKSIILSSAKGVEQYMKVIGEKIKVYLPPILERFKELTDFMRENGKGITTVFGTLAAIVGGMSIFNTASEYLGTFTSAWRKLSSVITTTEMASVASAQVTKLSEAMMSLPVATKMAESTSAVLGVKPSGKESKTAEVVKDAVTGGAESGLSVGTPKAMTKKQLSAIPIPSNMPLSTAANKSVTDEIKPLQATNEAWSDLRTSIGMDYDKQVELDNAFGGIPSNTPGVRLTDANGFPTSERRLPYAAPIPTVPRNLKNSTPENFKDLKANLDETWYNPIEATPLPPKNYENLTDLKTRLDGLWYPPTEATPLPSANYKQLEPLKSSLDSTWYPPVEKPPETGEVFTEATLATNTKTAWDSARKPYTQKTNWFQKTAPKAPVQERLTEYYNPTGISQGQKLKASVQSSKPTGLKDSLMGGTQKFATTAMDVLGGAAGTVKELLPTWMVGSGEGTVSGAVTAFGESVKAAFAEVVTGLQTGFTSIVNVFVSIGSSLMNVIGQYLGEGTLNMITSFFGGMIRISLSFIGAIPQIVAGVAAFSLAFGALGRLNIDNKGSAAVITFFTNFREGLNSLMGIGLTWITGFVESFNTNQAHLVNLGVDMVRHILAGLGGAIPDVIAVGGVLLINFISGLIQTLPTLVSTGFLAIQGFISGLANGLGILVEKGWEMVVSLLSSIRDNLPSIIQAGIDTVNNLVQGIKDTLPVLAENAWNLIQRMIEAFNTYFPQMIAVGGEIVGQLAHGLAEFLPVLLGAGLDLITWLITTIWNNIPQFLGCAWNIISTLGTGLIQNLPFLLEQAGILMGNLVSAVGEFGMNMYNKALEIGGNLINGLKDGISNMWESAKESVGNTFNSVLDWGKSILGINSPSTKMAEIGGYAVEGLQVGIDEKMPQVLENMKASIDQMIADSKSRVEIMGSEIEAKYAELEAHLTTQLDSMTSTLNTKWTTLADQSILIMASFNDELISGLNSVLSASSDVWTSISTNMNQIISGMSGDAKKSIDTMINDIKGLMDALPSYMNNIGITFMSELKAGIDSQTASVVSAVSTLVEKMKTTFLEGMGIHSPAKFGIYVADMIGEGLMKLPQDKVAAFYEHVVGLMQKSFENGKFNADQLVNYLSENEVMTLVGKLTGVDTSAISEQQIAYPLIGTLGTQTSWFGPRPYPGAGGSTNHGGVDLASPTGTPIAAALGGTVIQAGYNDGYGNSVMIDHGGGIQTLYGHMSRILANQSQQVKKGQAIGLVGSTGNSTGPHLHFEVRQNGTKIDPQPYLGGAGLVAGNTLSSAIQLALMTKKGVNVASLAGGLSGANFSTSSYTGIVSQALAMLGQPLSLISDVLFAIQGESGGNPNNINTWDSNAAAGSPSQGLLQLIPETFARFRNPNLSANILDPLANVYAGLNYMIQQYGSIENVVNPRRGGWYGYAVGTRYVPWDMPAVLHEGEAVIPKSQNPYSKSGGDYLKDLIENVSPYGGFDLNAVENSTNGKIAFDLNALEGVGGSESTVNTDNRSIVMNNTFNVTDQQTAEQTVNELDRKLHQLLGESMATGRRG